MSKPVIAVVAIAAIVGGGYSVAWYKYAGEIKAKYVEGIAANNEKLKPLLKGAEFLHYDSIETSGFPYAVTVSINKPVVSLPVDAVLRLIPNKKIDTTKIPADFSWIEEVTPSNSITITNNLIGSEFTVAVNGTVQGKSIVDGKAVNTIVKSYESPFTCHLQTTPAGFLTMRPISNDPEVFFNTFHGVDCSAGNGDAKDSSGAELSKSGKVDIAITHVAANGNRAASFKLNVGETTYTPAFDAVIDSYMQTFATATGTAVQARPYSFAELGSTTLKIDGAYNGPDNSAGFADKSLKVHIDLNALDFSSKLFSSANSFHVAVEPDGTNRKGKLVLHSKSNVSERYDEVLAVQTKKTMEELAKTEGKTGKELEMAQDIAKLGSADALVNAVLPKLHPLGDMAMDIDADLQGPNEDLAFFTQGHHVLKEFNILTTPYGIKSSGESTGAAGKSPSGNFQLTCLNCDAMINDLGDYIIRFTNYTDAAHPDKKVVHPTKALYDGIKTFAHSVALNGTDPNAKDLNFNAVMKDTGEFTVSGKQIMEVMQSYMTNVTANMPVQPVPAMPGGMPQMGTPAQ